MIQEYHPSRISKVIYERLLAKNEEIPDLITIKRGEQVCWIIYKGLKVVKQGENHKVLQYSQTSVVVIENKFLLELILKDI